MTKIPILEVLENTGLDCVYSHSKKGLVPPYLAYIGSGQQQFKADNTRYEHYNTYQVEYYYTRKNEDLEETIEQCLLDGGYLFDKSEDIFLDDESVFVIYYYVD